MIRIVFAAVVLFVETIILGVIIPLFARFDRRDRLVRLWCRIVLWVCGIHVVSEGLDRIPASGRVVVVANHLSHFDAPSLVIELASLRLRFIGKKSLFRIPFFGWAASAMGHVPIDRERRKEAMGVVKIAAEAIHARDIALLFFPEGTRSADGTLAPFKGGAFVAAIAAGVPVLPIGIAGTDALLPKHSLRLRSGNVGIVVGDPISTDGYDETTRGVLIEKARAAVRALTEKAEALKARAR